MQTSFEDNRGRLASFYSDDQPRVPAGNSDGGQWAAATGSTHEQPWAAPVRNFLARTTTPTPTEINALGNHLSSLTTEQLRGLRADHGVEASGSNKRFLVQKLREKFAESRQKNAAKSAEATKPVPMPSAARTTEGVSLATDNLTTVRDNSAAAPPKLHGTDKQIAYAESIRSRVLRDGEKYVAHRELTRHPDAAKDREALEHLKQEASARYWIDGRNDSIGTHLESMRNQHAPFSAEDDGRGRLAVEFTLRKFSSTQFNLEDGSYSRSQGSPTAKLLKMAKAIPDEDLAEDGREDEQHVTVKYGLHTSDADEVRRALNGFGPVEMTLGKTSIFPASDDHKYDVVKVDVDGTGLHRLNKHLSKVLKHTDTHPDYKPHITLAYVKPGMGKKYAGDSTVEGHKLGLDRLVFSDQEGERTAIPLSAESPFFADVDDCRGRLVETFA